MIIAHEKLTELTNEIFLKAGIPEKSADIVSRELVLANLVGYDSHGVIRVPQYLNQIEQGKIVPGAEIKIIKETSTTAIVDGGHEFGQVIGFKMADIVIEKAQKCGVACAVSLNAAHAGRVGAYTEYIAKSRLIGFCTAGLCYTKPLAPWGARESKMGTNPISWAVPCKDSHPIFMDISTTVCAEGKVRNYLQKGEQLPEGWIRDGYGRDTTDPRALYTDPPGSIYPLGGKNAGGVKGSALGIMANMFSLALANDDYWSHERQLTENGIFMMAIDPDAFCGRETYEAQVKNHGNFIKSAAPAEGIEEVLLPGEYEYHNYARAIKEGVTLPDNTWNGLILIGKKYDCEWSRELEAETPAAEFVQY